jgi:hypothetical protein
MVLVSVQSGWQLPVERGGIGTGFPVQFPQFVADLGLGAAGDLAPDAPGGRVEPEADRADVVGLGESR